MKAKRNSLAVLVLASIGFTADASADLIERKFVEKGTGRVATGTVLQGSKNMRDLGKRKTSRSSIQVLSPIEAVPGYAYPGSSLETESADSEPTPKRKAKSTEPKPRFGYGAETPSDGRTPVPSAREGTAQAETDSSAKAVPQEQAKQAKREEQGITGPVYQFRYTYPQQRDYYATPFHGFSPFIRGPFGSGCFDQGPIHSPRIVAPHVIHREIHRSAMSLLFGW